MVKVEQHDVGCLVGPSVDGLRGDEVTVGVGGVLQFWRSEPPVRAPSVALDQFESPCTKNTVL